MTDKLTLIVPKIAPLLRMLSSGADGEVVNAVRALLRVLANAGLDIHVLVERIEAPPLDDSEMQKIFDAGIEQGRTEAAENARRNAVGIPAGAQCDVGQGVGPYSWLEIARHCERNAHRLNAWETEFIASVARWLLYKPPTPNQASKLHDIFRKRFGERI